MHFRSIHSQGMDRRLFLGSALSAGAAAWAQQGGKPRRVGLIGTGWYGKIDLLRLIQVAPVEVVSLCDVDSKQLSQAADIVASRQKSGKKPQTYHDYRDMLKQSGLDICLIATPDHWHALAMIEACKAGADIYCQKPISVDVTEGEAMVAAARKYKRVVQVGTQRRSTPHLVEAKERFIDTGRLGHIAHVDIHCYYHMRATGNPPDTAPPANLDYEFWTGPAPMRPYCALTHPRGWRAFMEYGNGIVGDMAIHMFDMTRWMLKLGWPTRISSAGGIFVDKASKANITDTQTCTWEYPGMDIVWEHRTWGEAPDPDQKYSWGATFFGDRGTLKLSVYAYDFIPSGAGEKPVHKEVTYEFEQYPEDKTEKDLETHVAPAVRHHMLDLLAAIDKRDKPVADIEEGHISTASCILANLAMKTGRKFTWDPQQKKVVNDAEANALLTRPYRKPWVHPTAV
jgi:predicted dehydrogenase